jgi:hypothetical protein
MGGHGTLLVSMGSQSVFNEKNRGAYCGFYVMKMIYHGCVRETSMKLYRAMRKLVVMKDRNGARRASEKLCSTVVSLISTIHGSPTLGITDIKVRRTSKFGLIERWQIQGGWICLETPW